MKCSRTRRFLRVALPVLVAGFSVIFPALASAQSCSLCYTQAASASARFIAALRSGILILIIPPMFMSVAITVLAYRKRNQFNGSQPCDRARPGISAEL